jgi:PKD repeat protein
MGDGSDWSRVDPRALRTYNEETFAGKLMHVDRNGNGLPGHPFCAANTNLTHVCTKVYAKGLRNPFRFTLRNGTNPVIADVGWEEYEEIDLSAPGRNYGWPCWEGPSPTPGYKELSGCAPYYSGSGAPVGVTLPEYSYHHSLFPDYGASILAGPIYPSTGAYPSQYFGRFFFGDYVAGFISSAAIGPNGTLTVERFAGDWQGNVDLELGPADDLYYVNWGDGDAGSGSLKRIVYTPGNRTPLARAQGDPTSGASVPLRVSFNGSASSDPDGDPLTYDWNFGDGSAHSSQPNPTHEYDAVGDYEAVLTVRDGRGGVATARVRISVGNTPPVASIVAPADGSTFRIGNTISLTGAASDQQQGALSGDRLSWHIVLVHNTHVHGGQDLTGTNPSFTAAADHDADSHYRITLTATDSGGLSASRTIDLYPQSVSFTLASAPAGAAVTYAGSTTTAPLTRTAAVGFQASIAAEQSFDSGGRHWEWASWSDGGPRAHLVTIPAADSALVAGYRDAGPAPFTTEQAPLLADRTPPRLSAPRLRRKASRRAYLTGSARDGQGVKKVRLAVGLRLRGPTMCRWWSAVNRRLSRRTGACDTPRWMRATLNKTATGTWRWRVRLGARPEPGRYRLVVEAVDRSGNRVKRWASLTVRGSAIP